MVKIIMNGCNGHMGQVITGLAKEDPETEIAAGVDVASGRENGYPVFTDIHDCDVKADVVIDFSSPQALGDVLDYCVGKQIPAVLCTTGLDEGQLAQIEKVSKKVALLKSANMSLGINLLLKLIQDAAKTLAAAGFDMEVVEKHHRLKKDAPSGTALALADSLNEAMGNKYHYVYDRSQKTEARQQHEIGLSAVRGGTIVGDHDVIFAGQDEVVTFSHRAYSKAVFGKGALEAAKYLVGKPAGYYHMDDVIS